MTQLFQVGQRFPHTFVRKEDGELFAAEAIGAAAAADLLNLRGDHLQHLIADIMTVGVVDLLEMIDVDHGEGVGPSNLEQLLVQRAACRQPGQFVAISHAVRRFDQ